MHVAIDITTLNLTHIHSNANILEALVYLECTRRKNVLFANTNKPTFLSNLATAQLNNLYHNLTDSELPLTFDDTMRRYTIATILDSMQERKINETELLSQIEIVEDELNEKADEAVQFEYNPGARIPKILINCLPALSAASATVAQLTAAQQVAAQRYNISTAAIILQKQKPVTKILKTNEKGSPKGKNASIVWEHADRVWKEAGSPKIRQTILLLRKTMMDDLEKQGMNRNTVSCILGDWMKIKMQ